MIGLLLDLDLTVDGRWSRCSASALSSNLSWSGVVILNQLLATIVLLSSLNCWELNQTNSINRIILQVIRTPPPCPPTSNMPELILKIKSKVCWKPHCRNGVVGHLELLMTRETGFHWKIILALAVIYYQWKLKGLNFIHKAVIT